jgi:hypothetical protein
LGVLCDSGKIVKNLIVSDEIWENFNWIKNDNILEIENLDLNFSEKFKISYDCS